MLERGKLPKKKFQRESSNVFLPYAVSYFLFLIGAVSICIGIWPLVDKKPMVVLATAPSDHEFQLGASVGLLTAAITLISCGSILILMGFVGCCGVYLEIKWLLCLYVNMLMFLLAGQAVAVALLVLNRDKIETDLKENLVKNLKNHYGLTDTTEFSAAMDWAQVNFYCCGISNYTEYEMTKWWNDKNNRSVSLSVPETCCILDNREKFFSENVATPKDPNCTEKPNFINSYIGSPCFAEIKKWLLDRVGIIMAVAYSIVAFQVFIITIPHVACCQRYSTAVFRNPLGLLCYASDWQTAQLTRTLLENQKALKDSSS
ncbi:tetraspanin-18-like isoform X2 [Gigantopelta aegis]|uniref:tetraspanin-18-like isoform X2 n=1 Tax=Gigantopelta aegis TaxID=1735272 RepID=UPI001B887DF1|nr:tetraspanin-18-like isoform X2 [Gigantopelta aegis]